MLPSKANNCKPGCLHARECSVCTLGGHSIKMQDKIYECICAVIVYLDTLDITAVVN
jgi:hypothetical protein